MACELCPGGRRERALSKEERVFKGDWKHSVPFYVRFMGMELSNAG